MSDLESMGFKKIYMPNDSFKVKSVSGYININPWLKKNGF